MTEVEQIILEELKVLRRENKDQHKGITDRQDIANGRTRSLEIWRSYIIGFSGGFWLIAGIVVIIILKKVF